jgi:hypothetical protein
LVWALSSSCLSPHHFLQANTELNILQLSTPFARSVISHQATMRVAIYIYGEEAATFNYASMIISVLLMGLGFLSRVVRLHRALSIGVLTASRRYLSERTRQLLRKSHEKAMKHLKSGDIKHFRMVVSFQYRPALALFISIRILLDIWSSFILEVKSKCMLLGHQYSNSHRSGGCL